MPQILHVIFVNLGTYMPRRPEICEKVSCPLYSLSGECYLSNSVVLENPYGRGAKLDTRKLMKYADFEPGLVLGACENIVLGDDSFEE